MKKIFPILFLVACFSVAGSATAQITISPNPNITSDFEYSETDVVGYGTVTNEGDEFLNLTWVRNELQLPEGWNSAVCDNNQCYLPHVGSQEFTLSGAESGAMDVHVYPDGSAGIAIIEVIVHETSNPFNADTALYYFDKSLSVPERLTNALKLHPNPVSDYVYVENAEEVAQIDVYDMHGRLVKSVQAVRDGISLGELKSGNYLVRIFDDRMHQISTNLLVKD